MAEWAEAYFIGSVEEGYTSHLEAVMLALSALAGGARANLLLTGEAGSAKSLLAREVAGMLDGASFGQTQLSEGMPMEALLGAYDLPAMDQGRALRQVHGSLMSSHIVFLDEIEKASQHVQHALFSFLAERVVLDGGREFSSPCELVIATRNGAFDDSAFADRWPMSIEIRDVAREQPWLYETLRAVSGPAPARPVVTPADVVAMRDRARLVRVAWDQSAHAESDLWSRRCDIWRDIVGAGLSVSGRTLEQARLLLCGWASAQGRTTPHVSDLWVLQYLWADPIDQREARRVVSNALGIHRVTQRFPWPLADTSLTDAQKARIANLRGQS